MGTRGNTARGRRVVSAIGAGVLVSLTLVGADGAAGTEPGLARGEYLVRIMDCTGCHTPGALAGKPDPVRYLGGSDIGFEIPGIGVFFPPNLTPDEATGLGAWSEEDIVTAVRTGVRPDGRELGPVMPWRSYAALSDEDARAVAAYLKSLPPVRHETPGPFGPNETPTGPYLTVVAPKPAAN